MMNVEIAQRLAELRRERGFSQESLAEQLGLSRQAVSKWERAESAPDMGNLIALADLYGVTLDELLRVSPEVEEDVRYESQERAASSETQAAEAAEEAREAAERAEAAAVAAAAQEASPQKVVVEVNASAPAVPLRPMGAVPGPAGASGGMPGAGVPNAPAAGMPGAAAAVPGPAGASGAPVYPPGYQVPPTQQPFPPAAAVPITPPEPKDPLRSFPYPLLCAVLFLLGGFCFGWWHPGWVIFLTIPFYYWVVSTLEADPAYLAWVEERRQAAAAVSSAGAVAEDGACTVSAEGCAAAPSEEASAEASSVEGGAR
ncbi:helix-turn-helix domain-containing protein [Adlercreutzia sp. R7]|uniref:Helix-turn-helix domain-containing protein n=1 Tax=Adlercreutzia wanghongyangiae TaxID=3111451 RepID=A0ABU6IFT7_9ACTN|nr:helix-turn-helix domain-containing protein [Adlercreutzia sp. R7]